MADRELEAIRFFDYAVINDDLDAAVDQVLEIVAAERSRQADLKAAVRQRHGREQVLSAWLPGH
jgi:guanylate kinase